MDRGRLLQAAAAVCTALLISACGMNAGGPQEKIAVISWEQAVSRHPEYSRLQQGEKVLRDLLAKRQGQEQLAQAQIGSLNKLRALRQLSEQSYWQADFNTRMVEQRERENAKLQKFLQQAEAEVETKLEPRRREIENSYQLKIFNLRALLETVKLQPDERQAVEQELQALQRERGSRIAELQREKQALLAAQAEPYLQQMQQRLEAAANGYRAELQQRLQEKDAREQRLLQTAPKALSTALDIMDREIEKQQDKNDRLREQINKDIAGQAVRLAHERGYTIVFNKFRANVRADDITDAVAQNLQSNKR